MRRKDNKINLAGASWIPFSRIIGYSSIGMLALLLTVMLFPITPDSSFAACTPDDSTAECLSTPISTEVGVTTNTVVSLALDDRVQMEVVPKANGATSYASTKLAVSTNSSDGYAIYLQTGSETGNLTGVTTNLDGEISNTTKDKVKLENLENNSYGYALSKTAVDSNTTYSHVPTSSTVVESTSSSAASSGEYAYGDTYYLAFGTKIGTDLPAGQYAGTVTVSAVANPTTLRSMYDLTYMQDMTADICNNTKEHYTKQLIDNRDGKSYWVAKLKDGNCWMTQNLALDLSTNKTLTSADTDLAFAPQVDGKPYTWTPLTNTSSEVERFTSLDAVNLTRSWGFGEYVLANAGVAIGDGDGPIIPNSNSPAESAASGFVDVSGAEWKPTYQAQSGSWEYSPEAGILTSTNQDRYRYASTVVPVDSTSKTYDAHYLMGNYYQFAAATAQVSLTAEDTFINASICPKGWTLPSTIEDSNAKGSFEQLIKAYNNGSSEPNSDGLIKLLQSSTEAPLYFTKNGFSLRPDAVYKGDAISNLGWNGSYLSGQAAKYDASLDWNSQARGIYFDQSVVAFAGFSRWMGFPIRCLAR